MTRSGTLLEGIDLPPVLLVGLTGGIATGKSTVSGMFRELGLDIVDADAIVHDLFEPGGAAAKPVREAFGPSVMTPQGGVDRKALANLVFKNESERKKLEVAVHPLVIAESRNRITRIVRDRSPAMVFYDAALLVETGRHEQFHRLVVVVAAPEIQLQRLMERDHLTFTQAGARLRSQLPTPQKAALADYLIDNSGHWQDTRRKVNTTYRKLQEDAQCLAQGLPLPLRKVPR